MSAPQGILHENIFLIISQDFPDCNHPAVKAV